MHRRPQTMQLGSSCSAFYMGDDTIQVTEQAGRNSGLAGGRFLKRQKFKKFKGEGPGCFYKWNDFFMDAVVNLMSHQFVITSLDDFTRRFRYKPENIPPEVTPSSVKKTLNPFLEAMQLEPEQLNDYSVTDFLKLVDNGIPGVAPEGVVVAMIRQFCKDYSDDCSLQNFLQCISDNPAASFGQQALAGADQQQAVLLHALRTFKSGLEARRLQPHDVFRLVSAQPRSPHDQTGGNATNALNSAINPYQLSSACRGALSADLSDVEVDSLIALFFDNKRKKQIALADFVSLLTRVDDHVPAFKRNHL
eukprot:TRINITY_DN10162_c0_g1_i2.p1 TRINITY_DN10162_c0_g1~~TRINITY_DN10162_c0_g1_i2.p1  ORF type:complete len:306 (+),score=41.53 TRINITY_DN10162_c0_g1_i2:81-998(+)